MKQQRLGLEHRVAVVALLGGLPAVVVALVLLASSGASVKVQFTLGALLLCSWLVAALSLRGQVARPLQTLGNLVAGIREGDFSVRGRAGGKDPGALGAALGEVNALAGVLREERLGALEASALLRRVMAEIDVAILAFDGDARLALANPAGERLLGAGVERLTGRTATELGLAGCLSGSAPRTFTGPLPGGPGPWELRRSGFRQGGLPHELVVLTDLRRALREEERQAFRRLVRVLGHEINNSLAPIQSLAGSLGGLLREPRPGDWEQELNQGLAVITRRAGGLSRFLTAYAELARLPPPRLAPVDVGPWLRRLAPLERRLAVVLEEGPELSLPGDADQLDQLLLNLLRNAADAATETGGGVRLSWQLTGTAVEIRVTDDGPGLGETQNLFVPFFTTKPGGSGIGLVLSREIAEAHGGSLRLENRDGSRGCVATLVLPV